METFNIYRICLLSVAFIGTQSLPITTEEPKHEKVVSTTFESMSSVLENFLSAFNQTAGRAMFLGLIDSGDNNATSPVEVSSSGDTVALDASVGDVLARLIISRQQEESSNDYNIYENIYSNVGITASTSEGYDIYSEDRYSNWTTANHKLYYLFDNENY